MRRHILWVIAMVMLLAIPKHCLAETALSVLGKDYTFPNRIDGLPEKLSDFKDLQINFFETSDGVKLSYWEAGTGEPLVFVPGWSGNGAQYINVMYLLRNKYHIYVLDPRNQGLSQRVDYGNRISRFATDLKEFNDHIGLKSVDYCGHSMGAAVLWSYIDLYGTKGIHKAVFVDEPVSISARSDWSEQQRRDYGVMVNSPGELVTMMAGYLQPPKSPGSTEKPAIPFFLGRATPPFVNSETFAGNFIKNDPNYLLRVLFDHAANDWHDIITRKINISAAIFTGELSSNLPSQRWAQSAIPHSQLFVYSKEDQGDHLLMFRNPVKFAKDLAEFLGQPTTAPKTTESGIQRETLLRASSAWDKTPYVSYPEGTPELTVVKVTVPAHGNLAWHLHPMPNAAYVASGEITVEDERGNKQHFSAGEVIPETVKHCTTESSAINRLSSSFFIQA